MAFKVVDASGHGVAVRGWLLNERNDTLAKFSPHKFGIGKFALTPLANTRYRVLMTDEKGRLVTRPLPTVDPQGYTMRLEEAANDQLKITVNTNLDGAAHPGRPWIGPRQSICLPIPEMKLKSPNSGLSNVKPHLWWIKKRWEKASLT